MHRLTTTTMIFSLGLLSQLAHAAPPADVCSIAVHFADLDVTQSEAAAVLHRRLEAAAKSVCASFEARDLASQMRFRRCVETAIGSAVAKVDQPVLTAYHKARTNAGHAAIQIANNQSSRRSP